MRTAFLLFLSGALTVLFSFSNPIFNPLVKTNIRRTIYGIHLRNYSPIYPTHVNKSTLSEKDS